KNVDNAVVLARLFNEASGQKAPSKKHGLFISRPLVYFILLAVVNYFLWDFVLIGVLVELRYYRR
ncbi:MAG: hypothetical protein ACJA0J_001821, partial [Bdellovibrionota bacterium]